MEGQIGAGGGIGRGRSLFFLLSEEPLCAADIISLHHQEGFFVFFEHFILQTM